MFDLPAHLSTLNTIASPPSVGISRENDEPFWDFIHTDQLFDNFSAVSPEASKAESQPIRASAPDQSQPELAFEQAQRRPQLPAATLESIIAAFANETTTNNRLSIPLPLPYNSGASSSSLTPAPAVDIASVLPQLDVAVSPDRERITDAKCLTQMDAGPLEIEEDKRRRNTKASARFRAKKKEREQALRKREKELVAQVAQLVAEKALLENENKLLKGIVLGGQAGASSDETMQGALA
ncbi:Regulatory protein cys-3 [Saitozyma sp. JCM 24511]|nr:Regulatory protein cys-3 [Saitozyma sp. JCM 24511]